WRSTDGRARRPARLPGARRAASARRWFGSGRAGTCPEDALDEELHGGALHACQGVLAAERLAEKAVDAGLEQVGAEINQDEVQRRPLGIEVGPEQPCGPEAIDLRPRQAEEALEERDPRPVALEERAADVREHVRVLADEVRDPRADAAGELRDRALVEPLAEGLDGSLGDQVLDRAAESGLGAEVVLHEARRDPRGARDVADRGGGDAASRELAEGGVADA